MTAPDSTRLDESLRKEQQFFDHLVEDRGEFNPFTSHGWEVLKRTFRRMTPGDSCGALLDIGCGTGSSLQVYEGRFTSYTGLDLSPASIELARRKHPEQQ